MKKIILLVFAVSFVGFSQNGNRQTPDQKSLYTSDYSYSPDAIGVGIIGSPFLDNQYKTGTVSINSETSFSAPMRYNAEKEIIEYFGDNNERTELLRRPYIEAEFDGRKFIMTELYENGKKKLGYLNPLMKNGEIQLYFRPKKEILKEDRSPIVRRNNAVCQDVSSYYLKRKGRPAIKISLDQEHILPYLKDNPEQIRQYITGFNLSLKKEEDVIRLLDFYNSLNSMSPIQTPSQG